MNQHLLDIATKNLRDTVQIALDCHEPEQALVVYDEGCELTNIIVAAYRQVLPKAHFVLFDATKAAEIMAMFEQLHPKDLVILAQSSNFRLSEFRLRIELFKRELKTIEHIHLNRMSEDQYETYLQALAYDPDYYRTIGPWLAAKLKVAKRIRVISDDRSIFDVDGPLEDPKLNIGDYRAMKNVGGTFPIGEVFTEAVDLHASHGVCQLFSYAGEDHLIQMHTPFRVRIDNGILSAEPGAPDSFLHVLDLIRAEEELLVRECGFSLNRAMSRERWVNDVTAYERVIGLHLSLGAKHAVYKKPDLNPKKTRYHVDVFVAAKELWLDEEKIYENGTYLFKA